MSDSIATISPPAKIVDCLKSATKRNLKSNGSKKSHRKHRHVYHRHSGDQDCTLRPHQNILRSSKRSNRGRHVRYNPTTKETRRKGKRTHREYKHSSQRQYKGHHSNPASFKQKFKITINRRCSWSSQTPSSNSKSANESSTFNLKIPRCNVSLYRFCRVYVAQKNMVLGTSNFVIVKFIRGASWRYDCPYKDR